MIQGHKPNGWLVTADPFTLRRIELETRQCVHCQFTWEYNPHDEKRAHNIRGWCLRHNGYLCMRPECFADQQQMLAQWPDEGLPCIAFEEHYRRRLEMINRTSGWEVSPSGLIHPTSDGPSIPGLEGVGRVVR